MENSDGLQGSSKAGERLKSSEANDWPHNVPNNRQTISKDVRNDSHIEEERPRAKGPAQPITPSSHPAPKASSLPPATALSERNEELQLIPPVPAGLSVTSRAIIMRQKIEVEKADLLYYEAVMNMRKKECEYQRTKYNILLLMGEQGRSSSQTPTLHEAARPIHSPRLPANARDPPTINSILHHRASKPNHSPPLTSTSRRRRYKRKSKAADRVAQVFGPLETIRFGQSRNRLQKMENLQLAYEQKLATDFANAHSHFKTPFSEDKFDRVNRVWHLHLPLQIIDRAHRPSHVEDIIRLINELDVICALLPDPAQAKKEIRKAFKKRIQDECTHSNPITDTDPMVQDSDTSDVINKFLPRRLMEDWGIPDSVEFFDETMTQSERCYGEDLEFILGKLTSVCPDLGSLRREARTQRGMRPPTPAWGSHPTDGGGKHQKTKVHLEDLERAFDVFEMRLLATQGQDRDVGRRPPQHKIQTSVNKMAREVDEINANDAQSIDRDPLFNNPSPIDNEDLYHPRDGVAQSNPAASDPIARIRYSNEHPSVLGKRPAQGRQGSEGSGILEAADNVEPVGIGLENPRPIRRFGASESLPNFLHSLEPRTILTRTQPPDETICYTSTSEKGLYFSAPCSC
ncbi:hypothetical protein CC86DRAFT_467811 [Ophiobolus disseminans]|uniref:Uncharacterized protein n=1 Tax=Ophiobolus disseminans TaxID=1469910 RepID=A0A6A6ZX99_9PLEO|nr:hypothetical protein CC86DRAFT_467811 [Ophiobolus disseminans]